MIKLTLAFINDNDGGGRVEFITMHNLSNAMDYVVAMFTCH